MGLQSSEAGKWRKFATCVEIVCREAAWLRTQATNLRHASRREVESAFVLARSARLFAANRRAQHRLKHVLLQPRDDQILLEQIHDGRVAFQDLRSAIF